MEIVPMHAGFPILNGNRGNRSGLHRSILAFAHCNGKGQIHGSTEVIPVQIYQRLGRPTGSGHLLALEALPGPYCTERFLTHSKSR